MLTELDTMSNEQYILDHIQNLFLTTKPLICNHF